MRASMLAAVAALALFVSPADGQSPSAAGLRIVVVSGEDAVNVIQQKTAVAPVIEVRDRNGLPVSGALVTFSIEGGTAASFGGASTLTVATNAAGQAAVAGLTPVSAGAFQIQVSAAFQGQVATATIAQTNVVTAAQAAAASAASSGSATTGGGSGGAAGGGGLSTQTIVLGGAAVAGGAVAAVTIAENIHFDEVFSGRVTGDFIHTGVTRSTGVTCVFTWRVDAVASLEVDDGRGDRSDGHFEITGPATIVSQSCGGARLDDRTIQWGGNFTGTDASMRGSGANPFSGTSTRGDAFQGTFNWTFEGARSGDTITGVYRFESRSVNTPPSGLVSDGVENGSFQITWTKTGDKKEGR